jgi:hypothetical protein
LVLLLRLGIRHEGINPLPDALELGLLDDGFTKLQGFLSHCVFDLKRSLHDSEHAASLAGVQGNDNLNANASIDIRLGNPVVVPAH